MKLVEFTINYVQRCVFRDRIYMNKFRRCLISLPVKILIISIVFTVCIRTINIWHGITYSRFSGLTLTSRISYFIIDLFWTCAGFIVFYIANKLARRKILGSNAKLIFLAAICASPNFNNILFSHYWSKFELSIAVLGIGCCLLAGLFIGEAKQKKIQTESKI